MKAKRNIALGGVFVFFLLLFNAPFLHLPSGEIAGIPALFIYILIIWLLLIVMMALFSSKRKTD